MADITTDQYYPSVVLTITDSAGNPAPVQGAPAWASSDETVLTVLADDTGMTAQIMTVAPGTARISVSADADVGDGVTTITGVTEDINVTLGPSHMASVMSLALGAPADKVAPPTP